MIRVFTTWATKSRLSIVPCNFLTSQPLFQYGEQLLAIDQKGRKKMFKLEQNAKLKKHTGELSHDDIHGRTPYNHFTTHIGSKIHIQRPSLEEYVLLMPRSATITYPKDIWVMMGMIDIGAGATVVEAGTGSGALTLYLSRLVGECGQVISFEVRDKHLSVAKKNVSTWVESQRYHGNQEWFDNVDFHLGDIKNAVDVIDKPVDAVVLDIVDPRVAMDCICKILKPNGIAVIYLPNLSQVIQLSYHIWRTGISLHWDSVYEIIQRQWTVQPSVLKTKYSSGCLEINNSRNGTLSRQAITTDETPREEQRHKHNNQMNDLPFIARPSHIQTPHTAFLVKLRRLAK